MTTAGQQTENDACQAATTPFRLGKKFTYPEGQEFTILLSFKGLACCLFHFCGKWNSLWEACGSNAAWHWSTWPSFSVTATPNSV